MRVTSLAMPSLIVDRAKQLPPFGIVLDHLAEPYIGSTTKWLTGGLPPRLNSADRAQSSKGER